MADNLRNAWTAIKKLPTAIAGGSVDVLNVIAGGYANIADVVAGRQVTRDVGEGLVKKPVGGTEWMNDKVGLPNKSSGLVEDVITAVGGIADPSAKIGALSTAMFVPATMLRSGAEVAQAKQALAAGEDIRKVFADTGISKAPGDGQLRATLDTRQDLRLKQRGVVHGVRNMEGGGQVPFVMPDDTVPSLTIKDVVDFPSFFGMYPDAQNVRVVLDSGVNSKGNKVVGVNSGYMGPNELGIGKITEGSIWTDRMNPQSAENNFLSVIVHELQHYVQHQEGWMRGGSYKQFYESFDTWDEAHKKVKAAEALLGKKIAKKYKDDFPDLMVTNTIKDPTQRAEYELYQTVRRDLDNFSRDLVLAQNQYRAIYGEAEARAAQALFHLDRSKAAGFMLNYYDTPVTSLLMAPGDSRMKLTWPTGLSQPQFIRTPTFGSPSPAPKTP